jgi:YidC/Oxa1 family membrane protein insertase
MFGILARLLEILYSIWPSYGGSIILFTVVIMLVLAPLTFKSTRSMLAMQALQPEMKKLQNRYKDDRQKLNEEMMKFYKENKISPLGGCLPMLIQFPVFFILYAVLLGLTKRGPFGGDLGHSVACTVQQANGAVGDACTAVGNYANAGFFHPAYLKHSSDLYQSLSATRVMNSFGLDLSQSAWSEFTNGLIHALPYLIMVLVVMGLTYLQQQQIQSRQPKNADQNPTQQMMLKVMPIAMGFIYIIIPAGVVIYFLVSSVFRIGQQAMVTRTFYTGPNAIAIPTTATEVTPDGPVKKSFLDRFKPSEDSLPQVGKRAKRMREETLAREADTDTGPERRPKGKPSCAKGSGSKKSGSKKSGAKKPVSKASGAKKPGAKPSSSQSGRAKKSSADGKRPSGTNAAGGAKKRRPPASSAGSPSKARGGTAGKGRSEKAAEGSSRPDRAEARPSRSAPSRKAPGKPSGSNKTRR